MKIWHCGSQAKFLIFFFFYITTWRSFMKTDTENFKNPQPPILVLIWFYISTFYEKMTSVKFLRQSHRKCKRKMFVQFGAVLESGAKVVIAFLLSDRLHIHTNLFTNSVTAITKPCSFSFSSSQVLLFAIMFPSSEWILTLKSTDLWIEQLYRLRTRVRESSMRNTLRFVSDLAGNEVESFTFLLIGYVRFRCPSRKCSSISSTRYGKTLTWRSDWSPISQLFELACNVASYK